MPKYRSLKLTNSETEELTEVRDHAPKPYLRERASALLQVAEGACAAWVARHGLLKPRQPDTVYSWMDRYEAGGVAGLTIEEGRGRKAAYEP